MKRIILLTVGMAFALQVGAQDAISRFFKKYENDPDFTNVTITSRMFSLLTDLEMEDKEDQELLDAISKLEGLKIIARDSVNGKALYKEALARLPKSEYDELMSVRDEDNDMKFMIKEKGKIVSELIMVMGGDDEFFILSIFGEIDLKQVARISSAMDIDGLDHLKKIKNKDN